MQVAFPPLHEAALNGHLVCLNLLLNAGARVDVCENQFGTALHTACLKGFEDCVSSLLSFGANPDVLCRHETPLHIAAKSGFPECLSVLIDYGADIFRKNANGLKAVDVTKDYQCKNILKAAGLYFVLSILMLSLVWYAIIKANLKNI